MSHLISTFVIVVGVGWYLISIPVGFSHQQVRYHARGHGEKLMGRSHNHEHKAMAFLIQLLIIAPLYGSVTMLKWLHPHVQAGGRNLQKKGQEKYQDYQRKKDARG